MSETVDVLIVRIHPDANVDRDAFVGRVADALESACRCDGKGQTCDMGVASFQWSTEDLDD